NVTSLSVSRSRRQTSASRDCRSEECSSDLTTLDTDATEHVTLTVAPVINAAAASNAAFTLAGLDDSVTGTVTFHDGVNPDVVVRSEERRAGKACLSWLSEGAVSAKVPVTDR